MGANIDKRAVLEALRGRLSADLESITESQKQMEQGATHEEARSEGDKDMRATEVSYVARGLAQRVSELRAAVAKLGTLKLRGFDEDDPVALSALVALEDEDGEIAHYFVAPAGGGLKLRVGQTTVGVVTSKSPLGAALVGKHLDDEVEFPTPQGTRTLTVTELS